MNTVKLFSKLSIVWLSLMVLGSCGYDDEYVGTCPGANTKKGEYVLCLRSYEDQPCVRVNTQRSTPNGIYEEGTEIIAVADTTCSEGGTVWYNDITGEPVSGSSPYIFPLVENTYLMLEPVSLGY